MNGKNNTLSDTDADKRQEPADVIDLVLCGWKPGHFDARELAQTAMLVVGINSPCIDISLEALAADLIENDIRQPLH